MHNTIRSLIVDDEALARDALKDILLQAEDIEIIGECSNAFELIKEVAEKKPDLVFLDINMPRLNGFDAVELLGNDSPLIIFVTAYDEFAIRAFEMHALDYLMKPVSPERLESALERVREKLKLKIHQTNDALIQSHKDNSLPLSRILVRNGMEVFIIPVDEITYIKAEDDYIRIYTAEGSYLKPERMSRLEKQLDPRTFCRIHRSYIININYITKIEPYSKDDKLAILKNKKSIPISRKGYEELMKLF